MAVGTGILFIALGAILRYAITAEMQGIDLNVVGIILMIAGAIGAIVGLIQMMIASSSHDGGHTHIDVTDRSTGRPRDDQTWSPPRQTSDR